MIRTLNTPASLSFTLGNVRDLPLQTDAKIIRTIQNLIYVSETIAWEGVEAALRLEIHITDIAHVKSLFLQFVDSGELRRIDDPQYEMYKVISTKGRNHVFK